MFFAVFCTILGPLMLPGMYFAFRGMLWVMVESKSTFGFFMPIVGFVAYLLIMAGVISIAISQWMEVFA